MSCAHRSYPRSYPRSYLGAVFAPLGRGPGPLFRHSDPPGEPQGPYMSRYASPYVLCLGRFFIVFFLPFGNQAQNLRL